jgi:hypothetical protein
MRTDMSLRRRRIVTITLKRLSRWLHGSVQNMLLILEN